MKETLAALLVGVAIAVIVSCGGAKQNAMTAQSPGVMAATDGAGALPASPRDQIIALDEQITAELAKLELAPQPTAVCPQPPCPAAQTLSVKPSDDPACKRSEAQTCKDHCVLADSICENAQKICEIAKDLADAWANEKCASGNTSCDAAHGKCCGCT